MRSFKREESLFSIVNDILASVNSRHIQVHVLVIGDKETDNDKTKGHKLFMKAVSELSEEYAALEHHLIVCNLIPNPKEYNSHYYQELLSEVTIGLQVILSVEIFAKNLHFVNFQKWLLNEKRELLEDEFYCKNSFALNKKGIQKIINELLEKLVTISQLR